MGVETVIVTARKRSEDVQDVPLSISAVSGDAIERRGIANVDELSKSVPGLLLNSGNGVRTSSVKIRGVGSSGNNPGIEPSVGVYFDGAYQKQAGAALQANLLDVETVEVLRGPQGTLYGRNTPVGAVIIRSRAPSAQPEAKLMAGFGNYDALNLSGYVGGGLSETVAARLSFFFSDRDGYDYNISSGKRVNGSHQYGARLRARWTPSDNFTGDLIAYYTYLRQDCCVGDNVDPTGPRGIATPAFLAAAAAALGRPYTNLYAGDHIVDSAENPRDTLKSFGASFTGEWDLGGDLSLTSISAYSGARMVAPRTPATMQPIVVVSSATRSPIDTFSQEFRLTSGADRPIAFQVGTYVFYEETSYSDIRMTVNPTRVFADGSTLRSGLRSAAFFEQRSFSASLYGQSTWNISDVLRLTGGARFSYDRKRGSTEDIVTPGAPANFTASFPAYAGIKLRYSESKPTWLASLQYDVAPSAMLYGTFSTGWKAGGFNGRLNPPSAPFTFGPENATNYELGLKSTFLDRKLMVNFTTYQMTVRGFQDSIRNPVTGSGFIVGNAGKIRTRGFDLDVQARPVRTVSVLASLAYLDSAFRDYSSGPCYTGRPADGSAPGTCNYNGLTPSFSPKWRGSLGAELRQPIDGGLHLIAGADVSYTSAQMQMATLDPLGRQSAYTLANARFGFEGPDARWRVTAWVKNLTDKSYFTAITPVGSGGFLSGGGRSGVTSLVGWTGAPRTYGIEGVVSF